MENNQIGSFIAVLRKSMGLSQQELADKLHVTNKTISRWERGDSLPDVLVIPALAEIFGVTSDEILRGERLRSDSLPANRTEQQRYALQQVVDRKKQYFLIGSALNLIGILMLFLLGNTQGNLAFVISLIAIVLGCMVVSLGLHSGKRILESDFSKPDKRLAEAYLRECISSVQKTVVIAVTAISLFAILYLGQWLMRFQLFEVISFSYRWVGPCLLLGLLAGFLMRRYLERRFGFDDRTRFPVKLSLILLVLSLVGFGFTKLFMPTYTAQVIDENYSWNFVKQNYEYYTERGYITPIQTPIVYSEEAMWLHNYQFDAMGGASPSTKEASIVVNFEYVKRLNDETREIQFLPTYLEKRYEYWYIFITTMLVALAYIIFGEIGTGSKTSDRMG